MQKNTHACKIIIVMMMIVIMMMIFLKTEQMCKAPDYPLIH